MSRSTPYWIAPAIAAIAAGIFATALMAASLYSAEPGTPGLSPFDPAAGAFIEFGAPPTAVGPGGGSVDYFPEQFPGRGEGGTEAMAPTF